MDTQDRAVLIPTPQEVADLLHMRQEEKLARDVYLTFHDYWHLRIFSNIAESEQRHTDALKSLLERFSLTDPVVDDSRGVFADTKLVDLYAELTHQGGVSEVAALKVGAELEELDIRDLREALCNTTHQVIKKVYGRLQDASGRHLRSFIRQLRNRDIHYEAMHLTPEDFDTFAGT